MSIQYNDVTNKRGLLQKIERLCKLGDGKITGNTTLLKEFTAMVNDALDKTFSIIFKANGKWQFDDSNHTDYPFITTALVASQRDYTFTTDEQGNLILDVYKVMIKDENGIYFELEPVDQQSDEDMAGFYSGLNATGTPSRYDKTANGIFLDCIPSYSVANGLKVFINREGSYFTTSDTTKMPGFAGLFHVYLALYASYEYAMTNSLANKDEIFRDMQIMEADIKKHYRDRSRDEVPFISSEEVCSI
jgi:hypothetical protein